jgi:hypothetical protein
MEIMVIVSTDVSEELIASIIRVTRIGELGTKLALTSNRSTLRRTTEWERVWKETVLALSRYHLEIYLEERRKAT